MWRWVFAFSLLIFALVVAAAAGEYIGLWSVSRRLLDWAVARPALQPHVQMYRVGRGEWREWERRQEAQAQWEEDLRREARRLQDEWVRLERERRALAEREEALRQEEARIAARLAELEGAERRAAAREHMREVFEAMRPAEAAAAADALDDAVLLDILQSMEARRAAKVLEQMDPERVARLTRALHVDP